MSKLSQLPILKQGWSLWRYRKIIKRHTEVANFWKPIIEDYNQGEIDAFNLEPKKNGLENNVIWQYWGQGINCPLLNRMRYRN